MRRATAILILSGAVLCTLRWSPVCRGQSGTVAAKWFIPTVVNRYPNHDLAAGDEDKIIKAMNQACLNNNFPVRLVPVKTQTVQANDGGANQWGGDDGTSGGTAGDGDLTDQSGANNDEGDKAQNWGDEEVKKLPNKRGLKISFVRTPIVGSPTPGWSVVCRPTIFVSLPRAQARANARSRGITGTAAAGETAIHEMGHVLGLAGHAPNSPGNAGQGNFMAPSNWRTGTGMTAAQKTEMLKNILKHGKCAYQWKTSHPGVKLEQMFGTGLDKVKDAAPIVVIDPNDIVIIPDPPIVLASIGGPFIPLSIDMYDLYQVYLIGIDESTNTQEDTENIDAFIRTAGLLPADVALDALYSLGFDIDADPVTGVEHGGRAGIDRVVYIQATGNIGQGTLALSGYVLDTVSQMQYLLPLPPTVETVHRYGDDDVPPEPVETLFHATIPKALLELSAVEVPVVATAGSSTSVVDTMELSFDTQRWLHDPTLTTFGTGIPTPGQPYPVSISGLAPGSDFTLYLDDDPVITGVLGETGGFSGEFLFPLDVGTDRAHSLTAQDDTGEFAYNLTCPDPSPYTVIDDFESYDSVENLLPLTWADGDDPGNGTGAQVDLDTTRIHGGTQSMRFNYNNAGVGPDLLVKFYSETSRTFELPQNWADTDAKVLSLWFRGSPANSPEPLYVALEDTAAVIIINEFIPFPLATKVLAWHENPNAVTIDAWQQWSIDLEDFEAEGLNLASVKRLYIGVGSPDATVPGGAGILHIDDIHLSPMAREFTLPGDVNCDGVVNFGDLAIVAANWLSSGPVATCCADVKTNKCRYLLSSYEDGPDGTCPPFVVEGIKCIKGSCVDPNDCDDQYVARYRIAEKNYDCVLRFDLIDCAARTAIGADCRAWDVDR